MRFSDAEIAFAGDHSLWQAAAPACQPLADHLPRDFKVRNEVDNAAKSFTCESRVRLNSLAVRHCFDWIFSQSQYSIAFFGGKNCVVNNWAIGWQVGAAACQPSSNHPPVDFRVRKTLWLIGFYAGLTGTGLKHFPRCCMVKSSCAVLRYCLLNKSSTFSTIARQSECSYRFPAGLVDVKAWLKFLLVNL